jgi:hypothetical protein
MSVGGGYVGSGVAAERPLLKGRCREAVAGASLLGQSGWDPVSMLASLCSFATRMPVVGDFA